MSTKRQHAMLVVVVLLTVALGGCTTSLRAPADTAFAVVHLREEKGTCGVIHKTDVVTLSRSRRPNMEIVLVNDCEAAKRVGLAGFRHDTLPASPDPIETPASGRERQVPQNSVQRFRIKVKSDATDGRWSYDVRVDGVVVDPKIDIEK